jgi:hypothetical protein
MVMPVLGVAMLGDAAVPMLHASVGQMRVIMVMLVDRERGRCAGAEESLVLGARGYGRRCARATDMTVEADHPVCGRHDDMQIMGNQKDAAMHLVADPLDQIVKFDLARKIDALNRFVEHEKIGFSGDSARQHHPLELAAGQGADLRVRQMTDAGGCHGAFCRVDADMAGQPHETAHRERERPVDCQFLRYIGNLQTGAALNDALIWLEDTQRHLRGRRLPRPVGADQGHDFSWLNGKVYTAHKPAAGAMNAGIVQRGKRIRFVQHE